MVLNRPGRFGAAGGNFQKKRAPQSGCPQTVPKASQSSPRKRRIKWKSFSAAACTWTKTHLRLQVWNLSAIGRQIMRAADCKELAEKPEGVFRQAPGTPIGVPFLLISGTAARTASGRFWDWTGLFWAVRIPPRRHSGPGERFFRIHRCAADPWPGQHGRA